MRRRLKAMAEDFDQLKAQIRACRVCQPYLDHPVRPVVRGEASAVIRAVERHALHRSQRGTLARLDGGERG